MGNLLVLQVNRLPRKAIPVSLVPNPHLVSPIVDVPMNVDRSQQSRNCRFRERRVQIVWCLTIVPSSFSFAAVGPKTIGFQFGWPISVIGNSSRTGLPFREVFWGPYRRREAYGCTSSGISILVGFCFQLGLVVKPQRCCQLTRAETGSLQGTLQRGGLRSSSRAAALGQPFNRTATITYSSSVLVSSKIFWIIPSSSK